MEHNRQKKDPSCNKKVASSHPYETANWLTRATLGWMNSILRLGSKRPLVKEDIFPVRTEDSMEYLVGKLKSEWQHEINSCLPSDRKPRLWRAFTRMFSWKAYTMMFVLVLCRFLCTILLPTLMWFFLSEFVRESQGDASMSSYVFVTGIIILALFKGFSKNHSASMAEIWSNRLKVSCIGLIYEKILNELKRSDVQKIITGKTINLVTNDAQKMEKLVFGLHYALPAPFYILGSVVVLLVLIGWRALVGMCAYILLLIYIFTMSHKNGKLRHKTAVATDKRLEVMNEIISGIRAVKMYAWEWSFTDIIKQLRRKEMWYIRIRGLVISSLLSMAYTIAPLAGFISVVTLIAAGEQITAFNMFTILSTLNVINFSVSIAMGYFLPLIAEANTAINRIEKFLSTPTYSEGRITFASRRGPCGFLSLSLKDIASTVRQENIKVEKAKLISLSNKGGILGTETNDLILLNVSASWDRHEERMALKDVSFSLKNGQMMAVTGSVGSGKSSLLMAILGELPAINGTILFDGTVAYVPQIPWVFSGTIRDNVLFGRRFDEAKYHEILEICCMQTDLKNFSFGDLTEIGSRGVSLSGGQRVRVSLARALYSDADLFLLDDPLSAVDAKVGKSLFDRCICGFLSGKTRVFATHQLHYLTELNDVIVLSKGVMVKGKTSFLKEGSNTCNSRRCGANIPGNLEGDNSKRSLENLLTTEGNQDLKEDEEDRNTGSITWKLYWKYFRTAYSAPVILCLFLFILGVKVLLIMSHWWASQVAEMTQEQQRSSRILKIYGALISSSLVANFICSYLFYWMLLKASQRLHNKMVVSVIKAPLIYFDKTPVGRTLNRFSKDIGSMDDVLTPQFLTAAETVLFATSTILLPVVANIWLIFIAVPLVLVAFYYGRYYLKSSREIKRLEAITCSPVYSHISDTVAGLEIIRSAQMEQDFLRRLFNYQDENTSALMMVITSSQWLALRMTLLCSLMVAAAGYGAVLVAQSPALAGLSLTFLLEAVDEVAFSIRISSEVENLMTSVERVITYSNLDEEAGYNTEIQPPDSWPTKGTIDIKDLSFRYTESGPQVLKDINLIISDKEKIGVVGRTGAGKSSLVASLLRMPDPEGKVFVDGVDIGGINLQSARRCMAVIAQDPILFGGILRRNIDPFSRFTDTELWNALEDVQLKGMVEELPGQLNFQLKESGSNFSVGERQLVCLARALVQRSKIIIMDEATANVDFKTDHLIQEVIRHKFKDSTVLTIAHRLNTIMDYDKVLVLDGGRVMEFEKPDVLIRKGGLFADLVKNASESKSRNL